MRLFNKHYNLKGVGNPYFGNCIVVPNVDYNAYKKGDMGFSSQVEIIRDCSPSTGELDNLYIVPFIRCNETISCELNDDIYKNCLTYFVEDLRQYNFKNILLLGNVVSRFLGCDIKTYIDTIFISPNYRNYAVNYSPLIKYVDKSKFEVFKQYINKWYNKVINNYDTYSKHLTITIF